MDLKYQVEADVQKAIASLNRTVAKQDELIGKLREQNSTAQRTRQSTEGMTAALGGYITVAAGLALVNRLFAENEAIAERSATRLTGMADAMKRIVQISATGVESKALIDLARSIAGEVGVPEQAALGFVAKAATSGFVPSETRTIAQAFKFEPNLERLTDAIDGVTDAFGTMRGGVEGTANVALRMLNERTFGSMVEVLDAARANADIVRDLGGTFEDAASIATVLAGQRDPQQAGAQVRAFLSKLVTDPKGRFRGGAGVLEDIARSASLTSTEMASIFGEREKAAATLGRSLLLENLPRIEQLSREAAAAAAGAGRPDSLFRRRAAAAEAVPSIVAAAELARSELGLERTREGLGTTEIQENIAANRLRQRFEVVVARTRMPRALQALARGGGELMIDAADRLGLLPIEPGLAANTAATASLTEAINKLRFFGPTRPALTGGIE